ncbi:MAG: response regulator, partial [Candidatus Eremiobacteraeota bacterium]|nr:response regulator [Candidatus Eremiobacteraeota bacterium]
MKIHVKTQPKVLCAEAVGGGLRAEIEFLYGNRWDLVTTNNGHEALEILRKHGSEFKFAIIHSLLPVIGGDRLCHKIRETEHCGKLPLVLVGEEDEECGTPPVANLEFIKRPSFRMLLPETVDRCIAQIEQQFQSFQPKQAKALVVDDTKQVRVVLKRYLEKMNIEVQEAASGQAMEAAIEKDRPDFILLDVMMPSDNGLQVLQRLKDSDNGRNIPVIMVSGLDESDVIADALELGAVDYITKPICIRRFRARIKSCLDGIKLRKMEEKRRKELTLVNTELREKVELSTQDLKNSHRGMIFALSKLAESRDPETGEHLERLQEYCRVLCEAMVESGVYSDLLTPDYIDNLVAASPLHDIGKVGIPDAVLLK